MRIYTGAGISLSTCAKSGTLVHRGYDSSRLPRPKRLLGPKQLP